MLGLAGVAFGYQWVRQSQKGEPLIETFESETPPAEVQRAAEEGLPQFVQGLTFDELALESYGIKNLEEAQSATLGRAYPLYTVSDLTQLADYSPGQRASVLITPTQTWYFAVLIDNESRVDLTVSWHENRWQAAGIGGSLSKELDNIESITAEGSFKLVKIPPLNAVFVFLECANEESIIPLTPTGWFNLEKGKLYPAEEVLLNLAEEAKKTTEEPPDLTEQ